jgi:hypothetical protein
MRNQVILWSTFVIPWLTLIFMKKEDIKRFFPLGVLSALIGVIMHEIGLSLNWWVVKETAFPLQMPPYLIGLHAVVTMWIFKFTFKKFWLFIAVEVVANLGYVFLFIGYLMATLGLGYVNAKGLLFAIVTAYGLLFYGYQIWQEGIFAHPYREGGK